MKIIDVLKENQAFADNHKYCNNNRKKRKLQKIINKLSDYLVIRRKKHTFATETVNREEGD